MVKAVIGKKKLAKQPRLKPTNHKNEINGSSNEYFHLKETDEFFTNYNDYSYKLSLLSRPIWECDMTGIKGLTFWQAKELEILVQTLVVQRFSTSLRSDILAPALPNSSDEKTRKAQLVFQAHHEYLSTFFSGERITYKVPGTKNSNQGIIISEADPSTLSLTSTVISEINGNSVTPLPQKAYNVKDLNSQNALVLDSRWLTHSGILKHVKLLPLRSFLSQIVNGVQMVPEVRKVLKSGIPTQPGLTVEIPHKSIPSIITSLPESSNVTFQKCNSLNSLYCRPSFCKLHEHQISFGLYNVLEKLDVPFEVSKESKETDPASSKSQKEKEKKAAAEAIVKQRLIDSSIKYPVEDLELVRDAAITTRPKPQVLSDDPEFQHIIKIWSFLISFGPHLEINTLPLIELKEEIEASCSQTRRRFPLEKLIAALLTNIVSESDKVTSLWIPQGINDVVEEATGLTIKDIGDWRKAPTPVPFNYWGRVLLGCIKELYCKETLSHGDEIVKFLEGADEEKLDDKCTSFELIQRNFKASGALLKDVVSSTQIPNKRKKTSRKKSISSDEEDSDKEKEDDEEEGEENLKRAEELEPLIQQRFYRLELNYKIEILSFLIEQSLGTIQLREAFDNANEDITSKRRDRQELFKLRQECVDRVAVLDEELSKLNESYQSYYVDSPSLDLERVDTDSPSSTDGNAPKRQKTSKSQSRKEAAVLRLSIQSKMDEKLRQEKNEIRAKSKCDQLAKEIEKKSLTLSYRSVGEDRFFNRYYHVIGSTFEPRTTNKSAPILLVESTLTTDQLASLLSYPVADLLSLREKYEDIEQSKTGAIWAYYSEKSEIDALMKWLNPKGIRERHLKNALSKIVDAFSDIKSP